MSGAGLAALFLIVLHRIDGGEVLVNPSQIVSLHTPAPPAGKAKLFTGEAHCALGLADGKWLSVTETCEAVRRLLEQSGR